MLSKPGHSFFGSLSNCYSAMAFCSLFNID